MTMSDMRLSLPALSTQYKAVPRRYDETKPVAIQGFAHVKILGVGHELHQKSLEKAEQEKLAAIRAAEQAVWDEAERIKAEALDRAREDAEQDMEKMKKKLKKIHEKELKEEALKVEMAMQKMAIERARQERIEAEKNLQKAVLATEERCHQEKLKAVATAREEEKQLAADKAAKVAKENKEKFEKAMQKAEEEKKKALQELKEAKDLEKSKAVTEAENRERKIATDKLNSLVKQYEAVVGKLHTEISEQKCEINKHLESIKKTEKNKAHVENCLLDTKKDFQDFIDRLRPFDKGQADFILSSVYLDELEKRGYRTRSLRK